MAWRVPTLGALPVHTEAGGHRKQRLLVDAGVPATDTAGKLKRLLTAIMSVIFSL